VVFGFALGWLALVVLVAALANWIHIAPYTKPIGPPRLAPGWRWPEFLGTDALGRSNLSRVIVGARISLLVGLASVAIGMAVGVPIGLAAGYFRRWTDVTVGIVTDTLLALPPLMLLIAMTTTLGATLPVLIAGLALVSVPTFVRLTRANTLALSQREYVLASRAMGARHIRIMVRQILPNLRVVLLSYACLLVAVLIVAEGSLSFLGIGIPPPNPSWGAMIAKGKDDLATSPSLVFVPAAVMLLTVFALNVIGDRLSERGTR